MRMVRICTALLFLLLAACASAPQPAADRLLRDDLFDTSATRIDTDAIFAASEPMRRYLKHEIAAEIRVLGPTQGLAEALYRKSQLKLEYDAALTRNAAEAFDARAGNCLSLVLMTAAFAKELGLPVHYQLAYMEEAWGRSSDLLVRSGHVNLTLDPKRWGVGTSGWFRPLTIDFLPSEEVSGLRTREIGEDTIVAMYLNNRAVEILAAGRLDAAYAHARAAIRSDPGFLAAYNTLGVIYLRHGVDASARAAFEAILHADPDNVQALANLAGLDERLGQRGEAQALRARLAKLEPHPPFQFFNQGMAAMQRGDWRAARDLFQKEIARSDYDEFHYWLAIANLKLGEIGQARDEMARALQASATHDRHDLYAAKLERLSRLAVPFSTH